jgi:glutamate N-acetyltransferase/amino-acid N-acetyltransferase
MTTDTFPKIVSLKTEIDGNEVVITGIAKGSGMIEPNMATMLAYIFTDASISSFALQELINEHIDSLLHMMLLQINQT